TPPSRVSGGRLRLAGRAWPLPGYGTAETFVQQLVEARVLVRDAMVAEALDGGDPAVSARTLQRRVAAATGLSLGPIRQIARARGEVRAAAGGGAGPGGGRGGGRGAGRRGPGGLGPRGAAARRGHDRAAPGADPADRPGPRGGAAARWGRADPGGGARARVL